MIQTSQSPPAAHAQCALFVGGTRSGKSSLAQHYAESLGKRPLYMATAIPTESDNDAEMQKRITAHQAQRGEHWHTLESADFPIPHEVLQNRDVVLIDCLTLWLSHQLEQASLTKKSDIFMENALKELCNFVLQCPLPMALVSSEVGHGTVPMHPLAREFRDWHGLMNQQVAQACQHVFLVSCGLPLVLKGRLPDMWKLA